MDPVEAGEVDITTIHNVNRRWLEPELIEDVDIVNFRRSNNDKGGNASPQIQKGMEFDAGLVLAKLGPGKQRQTEINGGGVQSVNRLVEFHSEIVVDVEFSGDTNEYLGEVGINLPRACFVGIGQGPAGNSATNPRMIKF